jgi:hypothetical protein
VRHMPRSLRKDLPDCTLTPRLMSLTNTSAQGRQTYAWFNRSVFPRGAPSRFRVQVLRSHHRQPYLLRITLSTLVPSAATCRLCCGSLASQAIQPAHSANRHDAGSRGAGVSNVGDSAMNPSHMAGFFVRGRMAGGLSSQAYHDRRR